LAQHGIRVFMHGAEHHTAARLYATEALAALGVPAAAGLDDAARRLEEANFAYAPLSAMAPRLQAVMDLKALLGVRSPLHTVGRALNPLDAPFSIAAVTHPPYLEVHHEAARLLGQPRLALFKGEGGEVERRPEKPCEVLFIEDGAPGREEWPPLMAGTRPRDEAMDPARLGDLWSGAVEDEVAVATIAGTMAVALRYSGRAATMDEAEGRALAMWRDRNHRAVPGAA
jgi:anthranilate phosphoribosyltransferase